MKIRIFFICLVVIAFVYKLNNRNVAQIKNQSKIDILTQDQDPGEETYGLRANIQKEKASTDDSSDEELTALEYINKYVNHDCWPSQFESVIKCRFKNRGDREVSMVMVQIRASEYAGDGIDMRGSKYQPYEINFDDPILPHDTTDAKAEFAPDKDIKWVSEKSKIISAEY